MPLGHYRDDHTTATQPQTQTPGRTENSTPVHSEPYTFACGCVSCTSDNGSYTVLWCPQHSRAHGDTRDLVAH
jgi:hypothetical protein